MKTTITENFKKHPNIEEIEGILRACVHCGFCTATCPTYQELCDERDGPRGRIYLIKQLLEGGRVTSNTRTHLDRCLSCRSCETTCPSGVKYGRLVDLAKAVMETEVPRPAGDKLLRWSLRQVLPYPSRFSTMLGLGRAVKAFLPASLKQKIPAKQESKLWPQTEHQRTMLVLAGCVQSSTTPNTNIAAARVLDKLGINLVVAEQAGCCGAVSYHLSAHEEGLAQMKRNIDAWWPAIDPANTNAAEAIVMTASGCGTTVKEYGKYLADDAEYAEKAKCISELTKDLSEVLGAEDLSALKLNPANESIALHVPCSLQHGQSLPNSVRQILNENGFSLCKTHEDHLCCGSAGTYSILEKELSSTLLKRKLNALTMDKPSKIVTANVGCQLHLQTGSDVPVNHWVELLDDACAN